MAGPSAEASQALERLARAVDADRGAALYLDRGDGMMELVARAGPTVRQERGIRRWIAPLRRATPGAVARLVLPDERGGLLVLERQRDEPFSAEDLAVVRVQARRLAGTVATRLGPRPMTSSAQLEAVQSVAAQLTRLTSVEQVSAALCTQTHRVVAYDNARVYVLREDGRTLEAVAFRPHAAEYQGETAADLRVAIGEGITGWVAATGRRLNVRDAVADPRSVDIPNSMDLPEESMLLAPLRSEGRVIGVVVLSRVGLGRFTDDELRILGVLADQAAVAIENARLLAARDRHVSELAALLDISQASSAARDEHELAAVLAAKLRAAAGMEACLISRWDEQDNVLLNIGVSGSNAEGLARDLAGDRVARQVLLTDEPARLDPELGPLEPAETERLAALGGSSALLVSMSTGGRVVGLIEYVSGGSGRQFHEGEVAWLRTMANQAAAALENARLVRQLRDAAETDLVTGVYSHRHLQDRLRQETARAARSGSPLSVLMLDLDDFKRVNDEHGHQSGDRVLRAIAGALRSAVRAGDIVARYGGDEFVVLMPETDAVRAAGVAERADAAVAGLLHAMPDGSEIHVLCSMGLALYPRDGKTARDLLRSADAAMYRAKRARAAKAPTSRGVRGPAARRPANVPTSSEPRIRA